MVSTLQFKVNLEIKINKMTRPWLIFVVLYSIFQIHFICYAELSIPTRDFALRVPQAKPTKPETYVSLYRLLLCVILKGALK